MAINVIIFLDILLITHHPWKQHTTRMPTYKRMLLSVISIWTLVIMANYQTNIFVYVHQYIDPGQDTPERRGYGRDNAWFIQIVLLVIFNLIVEIVLIVAVHLKLRQ